ncbi:hypothetical protein COCMIDRAFT_4517 [Bipolaris oryzae ATCC 44560]|uniref:Uncharacterized protein n=1 Tax=Bipolaris oryzae ATCC 44560 TaxID=930090 RepID=W6Z8M7_COCMI|nr:uncharacterized protein COCMIDRAFT_4517 [Bipolaris oryzae ATCC 44560]EUC46350.1 hypothetical protein COCMIDRAFT_4517 [Bipolaris oryzae ATCC 44560]
MAPNGHLASGKKGTRKSRDAQSSSWMDKHGFEEYEAWKEANPGTRLPYDDWMQSNQHASGLSLYYTTLRIFEESDSSDENGQPVKAKPQPTKPRGQVGRPRKSAAMNGNGKPRSAGTATPSKPGNLEDSSPSAKKKRKARKKPLSEEIIASASDSDDAAKDPETSTPGAETAMPAAPTITITMNGKRKASTRKARKKPISEETISPEDELDDPMDITIDEVTKSTIASPLPVRSAPKSPVTAPVANPPKKSHILKLSTRKTPKKQELSEETVTEDVGEANASSQATPSTFGKGTQPRISVHTDATPKSNGDPDSATASPASTSAPGSTRRGLRTRKPAQQRPYYHDSQLFEDVEPGNVDVHDQETMSSPVVQSRRVSIASLSRNVDDALLASLDEEAIALLQEEAESEPTKPKHFKGKGRAWKKEGSDEDEDYSLAAKKKAAKAAKLKAKGQVPKKRGRPRKSGRSEELVGEDTDEDKENIKRKKPLPRKSALSEEIIHDSSDGGEEEKTIIEEGSVQPKDTAEKEHNIEEEKKLEKDNGENEEIAEKEEVPVQKKSIVEDEAKVGQEEEQKIEQEEQEKEVVTVETETKVEGNEKKETEKVAEETQVEEVQKEEEKEQKEEAPVAPASPQDRSWTPEGLPNPTLLSDDHTKDEPTPKIDDEQEIASPFRKG